MALGGPEGARLDLLVVGECNPDLVLHGPGLRPRFGQREQLVDDAWLAAGSSAAITACGAARLGLRTALASLVGDDAFGRFMAASLRAAGVRTDFVRVEDSVRTGVTVNLASGEDRAILTYQGAMKVFSGSHVDAQALRCAAHVHVSSVFLQPQLRRDLPRLLRQAREGGATTSLDPGWDPAERWEPIDDVLPLLDFLVPNEQEATSLAGVGDPQEAARRLAANGPAVIVKLGPQGALACDRQGCRRVAAPQVDVADGIGAGDTFAAALIAMFLRGEDLDTCVRAACTAGALSATAVGGTAGQPDMPALERALAGRERAG